MLSANDKTSTVIQVLIIQDTAFNTVHTWTGVIGPAGVRLVCPSDDTRLLLQQVNVLLGCVLKMLVFCPHITRASSEGRKPV